MMTARSSQISNLNVCSLVCFFLSIMQCTVFTDALWSFTRAGESGSILYFFAKSSLVVVVVFFFGGGASARLASPIIHQYGFVLVVEHALLWRHGRYASRLRDHRFFDSQNLERDLRTKVPSGNPTRRQQVLFSAVQLPPLRLPSA